MAHLNWRAKPLSLKVSAHPKLTNQLEVAMTAEDAAELGAQLAEVFAPLGHELRLDLPGGWTIYWKRRDQSGSRLQLARPQVDQWVASIQLSAEHAAAFLARLAALHAERGVLALSELGVAVSVVNFELVIVPGGGAVK